MAAAPYRIEFAECVKDHLMALTVRQRTTALNAIERQLSFEPLKETRNRKPLRPNPIAPWELRIGEIRVFYDVESGDPGIVRVLAVGLKKGNSLRVAGREIQL
jgi:mRNA-degrading endonuclease RelE of RelBE toxin-antitoxin system